MEISKEERNSRNLKYMIKISLEVVENKTKQVSWKAVCVHTGTHTHTHTQMHTYRCMHAHVHTHTHADAHTCKYTHTHTHTHQNIESKKE